MESMRNYVVRRAEEVKKYRQVIKDVGLPEGSWEWLAKLAKNYIPNPGSDRIERLYRYYKTLEANESRGRGRPKSAAFYKARKGKE